MRKATLSEPKHDERNSGVAPSYSSPNTSAVTKVDSEWEVSPRPWKKVRRTYSSRTKSQPFREIVDHDKDWIPKKATELVIRLPLQLTTGQSVGYEEDTAARGSQYGIPAQKAPPRAPLIPLKNLQSFRFPQAVDSAGSTGLSTRRLKEGICKALEALLRATTCERINDNSECRSLFSICLRNVPDHIAEEQHLMDNEDPENDMDVASEVYADLEAFGSAPDGGWESLREVVRSHGISLIGEAIREGLVELSLARQILSLCLGLAAYDEGECVIGSMIALMKSRTLSSKEGKGLCAGTSPITIAKWATSHRLHANLLTYEPSRVVGTLYYHVSQSGRFGFMYRQTAAMLEDDVLPVDWISSKAMIECWNGVIRSITHQDDDAQSAALLLQIAISKSYRREISNTKANARIHNLRLRVYRHTAVRPTLRPYRSGQPVETLVESQPTGSGEANVPPDEAENALQSTFSNILTVLLAVNVLRSSRAESNSCHHDALSVSILQDMALEIRQNLELSSITSSANRRWSVPARSLRLPLLSAGLVSLASRKAGSDVSPNVMHDLAILSSLPSSKETLSNAGLFLGDVARCCDEAGVGDGFSFVRDMVQDLISIATSATHDKSTRRFCGGLAHSAAFAFSEDTGQPKHLDWALDIERSITRTIDDLPKLIVDWTPARSVLRTNSGYKWEDGICEWIAKTPALIKQRPTTAEDSYHGGIYGRAGFTTTVQTSPCRSAISVCVPDQRPPRPKRGLGGRGFSSDSSEREGVKESCGNPSSFEKLLFIRVSPRPQKAIRSQCLGKVEARNDLNKVSALGSRQKRHVALREITNPPSGGKRTSPCANHDNQAVGSCGLDIRPTKRHRLDTQTYSEDTDDELAFP